MFQRLPIQDNKFATVLNVYAPTLHAKTGVKEAFYRDLLNSLQQVDSEAKLFILGDFNAGVGRDSELRKGVDSELATVMTTGTCLWSSALSISSSSPAPCSSRSIDSRQHVLDHALTRQRDSRDILHNRVMPSADCHTDHRLVRCKAAFVFKSSPKRKKSPNGETASAPTS